MPSDRFNSNSSSGFTLAELVSAGFVLGVFVFFALPVMKEMRMHYASQMLEMEISEAMQSKMEELQHSDPGQCKGQEKVKSRKSVQKEILLRWDCKKVQPFLYQLELKAEWKGFDGKTESRRWFTHRFYP
jgi:hypothetical protein